jgi:hypothetical protein
VELI